MSAFFGSPGPSNLRSQKLSYEKLIAEESIENEILQELAKAIMQDRLAAERQEGRAKVSWNSKLAKPTVFWPPLAKNFAAAELSFSLPNNEKIVVRSNVFSSSPEARSAEDPTTHSERYALQDIISKAIAAGWKPPGNTQHMLQNINQSLSADQLNKCARALEDITVTLFTEREPCNRNHGTYPSGCNTCSEFLGSLLKGTNHKIFHAVDWNKDQKKMFTQEVGKARAQFDKINNYEQQELYLTEHLEEIEAAKEEYLKYLESKNPGQIEEATRQFLEYETSRQPKKERRHKKRKKENTEVSEFTQKSLEVQELFNEDNQEQIQSALLKEEFIQKVNNPILSYLFYAHQKAIKEGYSAEALKKQVLSFSNHPDIVKVYENTESTHSALEQNSRSSPLKKHKGESSGNFPETSQKSPTLLFSNKARKKKEAVRESKKKRKGKSKPEKFEF